MSVTLTDAAARHVTRYMAKRGKGVGIRLGVKTTGCSGMAYKLEFADATLPEDQLFESHGVKVIIDNQSPKGGWGYGGKEIVYNKAANDLSVVGWQQLHRKRDDHTHGRHGLPALWRPSWLRPA